MAEMLKAIPIFKKPKNELNVVIYVDPNKAKATINIIILLINPCFKMSIIVQF